ncbi:AAA family ATPase [Spirulina subsalsa]|uniref:AAA family ATPase n=1 Tax=Spirulina subsalsa TaxID=54311 RepID=UPI0002E64984|nr:ATP-binding protein [Spirulina subsalsa]
MIKSFYLENFRCFESTKATGFCQVNLLGGQNNIGKTALLEALLLMGDPSANSILKILKFVRRFNPYFLQQMPHLTWENFFYHRRATKQITFDFTLANGCQNQVIILAEQKTEKTLDLVNSQVRPGDILNFSQTLNTHFPVQSYLKINPLKNGVKLPENVIIASQNGLTLGNSVVAANLFFTTFFIPANSKLESHQLATEFDKARFEGKADYLLQAFQLLDPTIEQVESFTFGSPELYVKRKNEDNLPLSLFGDAMTRIAEFVLIIINNKNGLVLVDEIENGIHHTRQEQVWSFLLKLCKLYNVQLFATSHSYEMINAFKNVMIQPDNLDDAGYFEMSRHPISNQIVIQKIPPYSLEDKLKNKRSVRGESI